MDPDSATEMGAGTPAVSRADAGVGPCARGLGDGSADARGSAPGTADVLRASGIPRGGAGTPIRPSPRARALGLESREGRWEACGLLAIAFVATASAARPGLYPVFADAYYHMSAIEGFDRAGGLVTHAFWELAPGGRPHLYPPALHAAGHLASSLGLSARSFVTALSWASYPLSLLGAWLWLRAVAGPRGAFFAVALLVGPGAWFWNQSVHTANALVFVLAPLALLALERGRFLACAAATFVVVAAHPLGLFLPAALAANALVRRERVLPGLAAAVAPLVLYLPWLAHVFANRAFFSAAPLGRTVELADHGFHAGILALGFAAIGAIEAARGRGKALGLLGPAAGFAVAIPLGFGGRFFFYCVHWPLAALGGFGATRLLERLERMPGGRRFAPAAGAALAFFALAVHPALNVRSVPAPSAARGTSGEGAGEVSRDGPRGHDGLPDASGDRGGGPSRLRERGASPGALEELSRGPSPSRDSGGGSRALEGSGGNPSAPRERGNSPGKLRVHLTSRSSLLVKLLDGSTRPDPLRGLARAVSGGSPEGRSAGGSSGPGKSGRAVLRGPLGLRPEEIDLIHRPGADAFLERVRREVGERAVVFAEDPVLAALISGASGRAASSGLLRDVLSSERPAKVEECAFAVVIPRGRRLLRVREPVPGFALVFRNEFGSLWKNGRAGTREVELPKAVLPTGLLAGVGALALALAAVDLLGSAKLRRSRAVAPLAFALAAACLGPLGLEALREVRAPGRPAPGAAAPQAPLVLPPEASEAYERLERALEEAGRGAPGAPEGGRRQAPRWTPEDEERFFELVREGRFEDALRAVEEAAGGAAPRGHTPGARRWRRRRRAAGENGVTGSFTRLRGGRGG